MKLTDLNPRWASSEMSTHVGITFDCPGPCCAGKPSVMDNARDLLIDPPACKFRIWVPFENPVFGAPAAGTKGWTRTGETFETLGLAPSVDASGAGHWHGWVSAGEVR